jgi:hypothetical protein
MLILVIILSSLSLISLKIFMTEEKQCMTNKISEKMLEISSELAITAVSGGIKYRNPPGTSWCS